MKKNFKESERLAEELLERNGNAFVVTSTYANFSQIWSYGPYFRERYDLTRGVIKYQEKIPSTFLADNEELMSSFDGIDPVKCSELDGGLMLVRMGFNAKDKAVNYNAVNIKCLFDKSNSSGFIERLVNDVNFIHPEFKN